MRATRAAAVASAGAALALAGTMAAPIRADDPVGTSVTFNREIIRILQRRCEPCHAAGALAMPLSDYREARAWGRAIREEVVEQRMPPPVVARGYARYVIDPGLNAREMATLLAWLDGGMPRGDEADRPPRAIEEASSHAVHVVNAGAGTRLMLPPQTIPAGEELVVRRVRLRTPTAPAGRPVASVQIEPGNRRVLRGAVAFAVAPTTGASAESLTWVGAWQPWQHALVPPPSHAFHLTAGATLVVDLYYRGTGVAELDASSVTVSFASSAAGVLREAVIEAAADPGRPVASGQVTVSEPASIWAVYPALEASVRSVEVRVERPDRSAEVVLWIPQVRPQWPLALALEEPVPVPPGSSIKVVAEVADGAVRPRVTVGLMTGGSTTPGTPPSR
jgi:hypothetical protein